MLNTEQSPFQSTKLISLNKYFDEMVKLYDSDSFPKVLLLNGKKGIGKFTLVFHFLNYIYSKKEKTHYNVKDKLINPDSNFYNSILNQTCEDVIFFRAVEGKNIKIDDVRRLKSILTRTTLSDNPRFTIIDEVEFLNASSVNALLKTLEEPTEKNFFILINNQQADLIKTISSRCLKNNIYLNLDQRKRIVDYFIENKKIDSVFDDIDYLTPGLFLKYNVLFKKCKIAKDDNILLKLSKLLNSYKKDKDDDIINMTIFFVEHFFLQQAKKNTNKINFLLNLKSSIVKRINDFAIYNLNIKSVLNNIEVKLKNVR